MPQLSTEVTKVTAYAGVTGYHVSVYDEDQNFVFGPVQIPVDPDATLTEAAIAAVPVLAKAGYETTRQFVGSRYFLNAPVHPIGEHLHGRSRRPRKIRCHRARPGNRGQALRAAIAESLGAVGANSWRVAA